MQKLETMPRGIQDKLLDLTGRLDGSSGFPVGRFTCTTEEWSVHTPGLCTELCVAGGSSCSLGKE